MIRVYAIELVRAVAIAVSIGLVIALAAIGCTVRESHMRSHGVVAHGTPSRDMQSTARQ